MAIRLVSKTNGRNPLQVRVLHPPPFTLIYMFNFLKKKEKNPENIKELLEQFNDLKKDFNNLSLEFENLKKDHQFSIQ